MLATPFTAWAATLVKSIAPAGATIAGGDAGAWRDGAACVCSNSTVGAVSAPDSVASRMRPVSTSPATKPARSTTEVRNRRRIIAGRIVARPLAARHYVLRLQGYTDTQWANLFKPNDFGKGS